MVLPPFPRPSPQDLTSLPASGETPNDSMSPASEADLAARLVSIERRLAVLEQAAGRAGQTDVAGPRVASREPLPAGPPALPASPPALPAGVPTLPAGVPTLPAGVPTLPAGVPTLPMPPTDASDPWAGPAAPTGSSPTGDTPTLTSLLLRYAAIRRADGEARRDTGAPVAHDPPAPDLTPPDSFERIVGGRGAAAAGVLVTALAVALGAKFAYDRGYFGGLPGPVRFALLWLGTLGMVGLGELTRRTVGRVASAGVFAAGVAAAFVVSYAGQAYFGLYAGGVTLALMTASAGIGAVVSARVRLPGVMVLTTLGAGVAPLVLGSSAVSLTGLATYLLSLQGLAIGLSFWAGRRGDEPGDDTPSPPWMLVRCASLGVTAFWTLGVLDGADRRAVLAIVSVAALAYHGEAVISGLSRARATRETWSGPSPHRPSARFVTLVTVWWAIAVTLGTSGLPDAARAGVALTLAAAAIGAGWGLRRSAPYGTSGLAAGELSAAYAAQAMGLVVLSVPLGTNGLAVAIGWGVLAAAFAGVSAVAVRRERRSAASNDVRPDADARLLARLAGAFAGVTWGLAAIRVSGGVFTAASPSDVQWLLVSGFVVIVGHALAISNDLDARSRRVARTESPTRGSQAVPLLLHAMAVVLWAIMTAVLLERRDATLASLAYAWVLAITAWVVLNGRRTGDGVFEPARTLGWVAAGVLGFSAVRWGLADVLRARIDDADAVARGLREVRPFLNVTLGTGLLVAASVGGVGWLLRDVWAVGTTSADEDVHPAGIRRRRTAFVIGSAAIGVLAFGLIFEVERATRAWPAVGGGVFSAGQRLQFGWTLLALAAATAGGMLAWRLTAGGEAIVSTDLRRRLAIWPATVAGLAGVKFVLIDTLSRRLGSDPAAAVPVANLQALAGTFAALTIVGAWQVLGRRDRRAWPLAAFVLLWVATLEIDRWAVHSPWTAGREAVARQVGWSVLWGVSGLGAVLIGFWQDAGVVRRVGLAMLALTAAKVLTVDVAVGRMGAGWRVVSVAALGALLLATSVLYGRLTGGTRRDAAG